MKQTVEGSENGKTIRVHVDDEIDIALDANLTTGYRWTLEDISAETLLTLTQDHFSASSGLMGSGGTQLFTFVAQRVGIVDLHFKYWRPFVGEQSVTRRFTVAIQIQQKSEEI